MKLPKIIDHKNMGPLLNKVSGLSCYQPGSTDDPPEWVHKKVILEIPLGELCEDALKTMALLGRRSQPDPMELTGKEGFNAQGLEGKVRIEKDLFAALMNLRDLIPPNRGRILTLPLHASQVVA